MEVEGYMGSTIQVVPMGGYTPLLFAARVGDTATARLLGLPVVGFDRYTRGSGQMRWRLRNLLPVMRADGPDITRSAAERHAGELLLYVPAAAVDGPIAWRAVDEDHATARVQLESAAIDVTITVASNCALSELVLSRWGNPDGTSFIEHIFGAAFKDEVTFGGVTLPREVTAGWHYGTPHWPEGQFIRYSIADATYS